MTSVIAVLVLVLGLLAPPPVLAGEPVTFAYAQLGLMVQLPWQVALGQKYFEEQGLDPTGLNFDTGTKSIAALIGGSADFAANALEHAIKAKVQGKDLVYVFAGTRLPGWGLAASTAKKSEIKTFADLRGKTVGVSGIGAASHVLLNYVLLKNGVDPKDVKVIATGVSAMPSAMEGGKIDAGMLGEPFFSRMIARGTAFSMGNMSTLKDTRDILGGEYAFAGAITRPDVIQKRPHVVQKVVNALVKAANFIQTRSPEEITSAIPQDLVGDRAVMIETIRHSKEVFSPGGMLSQNAVDTVVKTLEAFGVFKEVTGVNIASTYDMTFVQRAMRDVK